MVHVISALMAQSYAILVGVDKQTKEIQGVRGQLFTLVQSIFASYSSLYFSELCQDLENPLGVWMTDPEGLLSSVSINLVRSYYSMVRGLFYACYLSSR